MAHSRCAWSPAKEQALENPIVRHDKMAKLAIINCTIHIVIIPSEDQVLLLPIEEGVANIAEQSLTELALRELLEAAEVEGLES